MSKIMNKFINTVVKYVIVLVLLAVLYVYDTKTAFTPGISEQEITAYAEDYRCMYAVILHEARGESYKGKEAVADVVINRLRHKTYPSSICDVVTQPKQFSYIDKTLRKVPKTFYSASNYKINTEVAAVAYNALQKILEGSDTELKALYYHNTTVTPYWATKVKYVGKVGKHHFYI